jgi:hypothetical protein
MITISGVVEFLRFIYQRLDLNNIIIFLHAIENTSVPDLFVCIYKRNCHVVG